MLFRRRFLSLIAFIATAVGFGVVVGSANLLAFVPPANADLNDDGRVNSRDQLLLALYWQAGDMRADVNRDGRINSIDQLAIAYVYLDQLGIDRSTPTPSVASRNPLLWPYSPTSPWNMPIGSGAVYVPSGVTSTFMAWEDEIIAMQPTAPQRPVIVRNTWNAACDGSTGGGTLPVPDGLVTPLTSPPYYPNNSSAFVLADGRTVREGNWSARCTATGPLYWGLQRDTHSLYGDGYTGFIGGHGGSGLTALGGSLRLWEIQGDAPIRHALKLTLSAQFLSPCNDGHRWPAHTADQGHDVPGHLMEYKGTTCAMRMGSLLAIPPGENCDALVSHAFARRVCWTLQNYGAYVVDGSPSTWQPYILNMELGGNQAVRQRYGTGIAEGTLGQQLVLIMSRLRVVDNNGATTPGGGGSPRQPLAPPLAN